jgi:anti-sigma factor (TIGR02949 family)
MTRLLTCKQFLHDLNEYLEETLDSATREQLQKHVDECPNCWVVCDTTARTLKVFKGFEAQPVPKDIQSRLMAALEKKMQEEGPCCKKNKLKKDDTSTQA